MPDQAKSHLHNKSAQLPAPAADPDLECFRINQAAAITGLSRSTIYALMDSGTLETRKVLRTRLIVGKCFRKLLQTGA